jgi:hypothetical protein
MDANRVAQQEVARAGGCAAHKKCASDGLTIAGV